MNSLQIFREKCPRLFWVADRCLVFFVLLPSVVAFWAGIWVLLDLHFYPEDEVVGAWTCAAVGAIILVFFNVVQYELTKRYLEPRSALKNIVIKRLYTLIAGCANVFLCRGFWLIQDYYSGISVESACFSFIFGTLMLVALRASCNGIASPLGTAFDEHRSFFIIQTRFRATADRPLLLLLDSVFSVTVIGTLVIFEWRGIWVLLDLLLFPEHPSMNITICIVFGYGICFIVDTLQNRTVALSAHLDSKKLWLLRLAFEDVYLFMAKLGVIALWHGLWVFCESVVTDREGPNELVRVWIPITIGYLVPTLLLHANSIFVLEVVLDGGLADGIGCRVRVTMLENYLKLFAKNQNSGNSLIQYASGKHGDSSNNRGASNTDRTNFDFLHREAMENRSFILSEVLPP